MTETSNCKSCGTPLQGPFCHVCGEKRLTAEDKSLKRWLGELLSSIWMLDGKLLKTLKYLILKPGQLAADYVSGRRKPYVRPLNIFLIANVIYFLSPTFDTFKTSLQIQRFNTIYETMVKNAVEVQLEEREISFEEFMTIYDRKTTEISKLILIVLAPLTGLLLFALFRKQGLFLSDGFALALQYWAFFMLIFILFLPYLDKFQNLLTGRSFFIGEMFITGMAHVISGIYFYFQMRHWKGEKAGWYWAKLFIFMLAFFPILMVYRFILFWATYLAL